ncbi:MAG: c-type cytochrome, partial [Verrucomicrobiales bacterium]|nr:c-type cytochrome [Verrucomicrobiales bacterium]
MRPVALALLLSLPMTARAVVSEDALPNQADWISASAEASGADTAFFRRTFEIGTKVVKAVLLAAADQRAVIRLNGSIAAEVNGFAQAITVDVTPSIRSGTNALTVRVANDSGQAAFRLMLELAFADGRQRWVISDRHWLASRAEAHDRGDATFSSEGWRPAFAHGTAGLQKWGNPFSATKSVDAYNSWMLARGAEGATDPGTISLLPDFRIELLRSAQPDEDSWVALAFDPMGRVTVAREKRGLLRMTLSHDAIAGVEVINDTLLECRGLLYAYDSLYVNANNSKGFYRLRDTDGDGQFDEQKLLLQTAGGVGHGRNHLALGPDGFIYLAHGDDVVLPPNLATNSPLQQMANDQLMPARDPRHPQNVRRFAQVGHVLQTDRDGSFFRLVAGGLRNPLDVAFDEHGQMFTYDADMERDIAAPWYQPSRVLHLVPGGDYGWRRSVPNLPPHAPDTLPAVADIGVGSPTGVAFGSRSHFPEKYRGAFFIADWAYGRILAVHLRPDGGSYRGSAETFLSGRPLNVTDLTFGPDGAMYFITGGRGTKSGLYRVSHNARRDWQSLAAPSSSDHEAARRRALRHKLETLGSPDAAASSATNALDEIWPHLGHADRWIRYAARTALERQPIELWGQRALSEHNPRTALAALLALARLAGEPMQSPLLERIGGLPLATMPEAEQVEAFRLIALRFARFGRPGDEIALALTRQLNALYPAAGRAANHELCRLLTFLRAPEVIAKTIALLGRTRSTEDLLHYSFFLSSMREGWTIEQRRLLLESLRRAEQEQGGSDYYSALKAVRKELVAELRPEQSEQLADVLAPASPMPLTFGSLSTALSFVRDWKLEDFDLGAPAATRRLAAGRQAYTDAGCAQCHRFGHDGGVFGPDLTSVGARFGRRDLLDTILNPSKAIDEKYRSTSIILKNGDEITGLMEREDDETVALGTGAIGDTLVEIQKAEIATRRLSEISPMPAG